MALFTLSAVISTLFLIYSTPLVMALLIVAQAITAALSIYLSLSNSWFSFILLMILVSAMMVIFVYVSSLASNDFLVTPHSVLSSALYLCPFLLVSTYLTLSTQMPAVSSQSTLSDTDIGPATSYKLYSPYTSALTMFLIIYLLVALVVVAKISLSPKGALRALNP